MAQVQRGNVFLTIGDSEVEKYMAKGFSVVDEKGNVIRQSFPTELSQLQKAWSEHVEIIKQKDEEIARLKAELEALKTAGVDKTPAAKQKEESAEESWDNWEEPEQKDEDKPAKKQRKKA